MHKITTQAKIIVLALTLALGISYVSAAGTWTGPTATPPGGNVDTPVNVGNNAQSKAGDLAVGAFLANLNSKFLGKVTIQDGTQGAGKVLTSDANGVASWATGGGGGSAGLDQLCNTVDTGISFVGTKQISLLLGGKNMCTDANGCSYKIWRYNASYPEGVNLYGSNAYQVRQYSNGRWVDSAGNTRGINGDTTAKAFLGWEGLTLSDDSSEAGGETSPDALSLKDSQNDESYVVTMCDL